MKFIRPLWGTYFDSPSRNEIIWKDCIRLKYFLDTIKEYSQDHKSHMEYMLEICISNKELE